MKSPIDEKFYLLFTLNSKIAQQVDKAQAAIKLCCNSEK
jgi:hypothetical protein